MTYKALKLVLKKRKVFAKYKDRTHPAYKAANNKAKTELRNARRAFEKKLATNVNGDSKSFFAYARCVCNGKPCISTLKKPDGTLV
jgi:hypothetical protein